jgi:hypothetical protein
MLLCQLIPTKSANRGLVALFFRLVKEIVKKDHSRLAKRFELSDFIISLQRLFECAAHTVLVKQDKNGRVLK